MVMRLFSTVSVKFLCAPAAGAALAMASAAAIAGPSAFRMRDEFPMGSKVQEEGARRLDAAAGRLDAAAGRAVNGPAIGRIVSTGQAALRMTASATLPTKTCLSPL